MSEIEAVKIGKRFIGQRYKPFIVAELSGNHNQSLDRALQLIEAAAKAGVDAVKLQTYTADTITVKRFDEPFRLNVEGSLWDGRFYYELYEEAHTPWEWHETLFNKARSLGLECFSSPFDDSAVDFLESLDCPCYKIASPENTDTLLLKKVAATGKPVVISTGASTASEISDSVAILRSAGCPNIIVLKCTAAYPADAEGFNLKTIPHMQALLNCHIGLSDHSLGVGVAVASVALGAVLIEKHLVLSRDEGGVDAAFSMEPHEFLSLVEESARAWKAVGSVEYGPSSKEAATSGSRRSLYIMKDMAEGDMITLDSIASKRPALGIPVRAIDTVLGMRLLKSVTAGTPLTWELLKEGIDE